LAFEQGGLSIRPRGDRVEAVVGAGVDRHDVCAVGEVVVANQGELVIV
jgi:hypothetical protein